MKTRCALLLVLAACGSKGSKDEPASDVTGVLAMTAKTDGPQVVLTTTCPEYGTLEARGESVMCKAGPTELRLLASKLGAGTHTITADARHGEVHLHGEVTVTVPAAALAPYMVIADCNGDISDKYVGVTVKSGGKSFDCNTFHGARVRLAINATPNAKLTFGTKAITIPESGVAEPIVDLTEGILAFTVDQLADSERVSPPIEVPWTLEVAGTKLAGKITVQESILDAGGLAGLWLADVAAGKIDRPAFSVAKPGERRTIVLLGTNGKVQTTDRRGTVRDLDLIAVETEASRVEQGHCDFDSDGKQVRARRFAVTIDVKVTNLVDGSAIGTRSFTPSADGCPMFDMFDPADPQTVVGPDRGPVMKWLETLALPTA